MSTERNRTLDIARGIAMICIVLGHLGLKQVNSFVFTFHVPVFYLISGYYTKKQDLRETIRRKLRTLIVPYWLSCGMIILSAWLMNQAFSDGWNDKQMLLNWVKAALYGAGDPYKEPFAIPQIGAIWFLLAMFWGSVWLQLVLRLEERFRFPVVILVFLICCHTRKPLFWFPMSVQAGGPALFFMYCGYLAREFLPAVKALSREARYVLTGAAFWIWIEFVLNFKSFWLVHSDYGRGVVDLIGSLCACACVILLSGAIAKKGGLAARGLAYLGYYSLLMLCMHIVELDTFRWDLWIGNLFPGAGAGTALAVKIIGKFVWIIGMTVLVSSCRPAAAVFGYGKRKQRNSGT